MTDFEAALLFLAACAIVILILHWMWCMTLGYKFEKRALLRTLQYHRKDGTVTTIHQNHEPRITELGMWHLLTRMYWAGLVHRGMCRYTGATIYYLSCKGQIEHDSLWK